jgi:hypothetical protein
MGLPTLQLSWPSAKTKPSGSVNIPPLQFTISSKAFRTQEWLDLAREVAQRLRVNQLLVSFCLFVRLFGCLARFITSTLKMLAAHLSETLAFIKQSTRRLNTKVHYENHYRCENLKSHSLEFNSWKEEQSCARRHDRPGTWPETATLNAISCVASPAPHPPSPPPPAHQYNSPT